MLEKLPIHWPSNSTIAFKDKLVTIAVYTQGSEVLVQQQLDNETWITEETLTESKILEGHLYGNIPWRVVYDSPAKVGYY